MTDSVTQVRVSNEAGVTTTPVGWVRRVTLDDSRTISATTLAQPGSLIKRRHFEEITTNCVHHRQITQRRVCLLTGLKKCNRNFSIEQPGGYPCDPGSFAIWNQLCHDSVNRKLRRTINNRTTDQWR